MHISMNSAEKNAKMGQNTRDTYIEQGLQYMCDNPSESVYFIHTGDMMLVFSREFARIVVQDCKIVRQGAIPVAHVVVVPQASDFDASSD